MDLATQAEAFALPYYAEPHRTYHNATHIKAVYHALEVRGLMTLALALAVWGHDLVYNPAAKDNEEQSAEIFGVWLGAQGASAQLLADVRRLILATKHTDPASQRDEALLIDADLSILGADAKAFKQYNKAIRQEYKQVPSLLYKVGRRKILKSFLARPQIFCTPEFAGLELQARVNLNWAIKNL